MFNQFKTLKADKPFPKDYSTIQLLHDQLIAELDNLPATLRHLNPDMSWDSRYPYLKQHREFVLIYANLFLMTLHRPHVSHHSASCRHAIQASITALNALDRCFAQSSPAQYKSFPLSFYTLDASIFLSTVVAMYPPIDNGIGNQVDAVLQHALHRLAVLETYSPIAKSGLAILRRCCGKLKDQCPGAHAFAMSTSSGPSNFLPSLAYQDAQQVSSQSILAHGSMTDSHSAAYSQGYGQDQPTWLATGSRSDSYPSGSNSGEDTMSTMADGSLFNTPTDFDESYWMNLMNSIASAPVSLVDANDVWSDFS